GFPEDDIFDIDELLGVMDQNSKTAQNVCKASTSKVDIDELLGVMDQNGESIDQAGSSGHSMYDAWFENKLDFDFDFLERKPKDFKLTLEDFVLSLDPTEPFMQTNEEK
nr:hypothetical protein [Tanacetum cinerariifolium]